MHVNTIQELGLPAPGLPGTSEGGAPGSVAGSEPRSWHSEMLLLRSRLGSMGRSISSSSPILSLSRTETVLWGGVSVPPVTCRYPKLVTCTYVTAAH